MASSARIWSQLREELQPSHLAQEYPAVATAFHTYMARFLAERLTQTTETLRALAD